MADQQYYSLFTKQGLALLTDAIQHGTKLGITSMAFGDGSGSLPVPNESMTKLVNEVYRTQLNSLAPDPNNANWLRAEAIIASAVGGFNIRELGLYAGDTLVAYSNYPSTYKPNPSDGTARIMTFRMVLQIDNTASFELKIDPDVVLATITSVSEAKQEIYENTVNTVRSLSDLKNLNVSNHRIVNVLFRTDESTNYFSGNFIYLDSSTLAENGGTVFTSAVGNGRWFRLYSGDVNALWFGIPDGKTDQNILNPAIQCAIDNGKAIDITGSKWGITSEIKIHSSLTLKSILDNKISVYQGNYTNNYAVEVGDPSKGWMDGRSTLTSSGMLWLECSSREFKLKGIYIKGSFNAIGSIRSIGFNGTGCRLDAFHDSQVGRISVELCGNEDEYAFDCSSKDDTCNAFSIDSLQVEQSYQRGIKFTETIRATVNNIHSERLITTNKNPTTDNPLGYDLNHIFNTANSTFNQALLDSTDTDLYVRIDGVLCTYTNFYVDQGNVYGSFGENTTYVDLFAKSFLQYGTYKSITFIDPNVPTMTLTDTATVHNPEITDMIFGYQAQNINIFGGSITNYGSEATSDVAMGNINAFGTNITNVYKTGNADGYCSGLNNCKITNFYGNWENLIKVLGGTIDNANLVSRSLACFDGVTFKDFKANGDLKYITRNCTATGSVTWSVPTALTTQLGTLTERIGYSIDGKIYQYDGKSWSKLI